MVKYSYLIYSICLAGIVGISGCSFIVSKLTFFPDTKNTIPQESLPPYIQRVSVTSDKNVSLSCLYLKPNASERIVLYFHGNASTIDQCVPELLQFCRIGVNVFGVEYRGYGNSTGWPNEKGVYKDGASALQYIVDSLNYRIDSVFICGRSIGSAVAVDISRNLQCAGIILITPMTSGNDMGRKMGIGFLSPFMGNPFDNMGKSVHLVAPILILHGTDDATVPFSMGLKLYRAIESKKLFVKIDGGHHNDLELVDSLNYWGSVREFIQNQNTPPSARR